VTALIRSLAAISENERRQGVRVLIIEDSGVGQLLRTIVKRDGHEPVLAGTGKGGWRLLMSRALPPDLLILDRMLPDMDGAEVLTRLRGHPRTADLPVLVLTAAARSSLHLDDGALTRVLAKPFDLVDLRRVLADLASEGARPPGDAPLTPHGRSAVHRPDLDRPAQGEAGVRP
jgi:CheY-like chemotaxis protein